MALSDKSFWSFMASSIDSQMDNAAIPWYSFCFGMLAALWREMRNDDGSPSCSRMSAELHKARYAGLTQSSL
ncbi:hypothetical protein KUC_3103 [Vreelandella boliviensis LC1]|uniref:Uncharacterized protein n=1 Tax=Vreelandella boliviensis LC1 TaxID=1072583 RepID=A0A7U9GFD0_9GAMM|nr:hypothetical protein KUC_3103 [Halomonas boliviensis LC1]